MKTGYSECVYRNQTRKLKRKKIKSLPLYIHIISSWNCCYIGSKFSLAVTILDSSSSWNFMFLCPLRLPYVFCVRAKVRIKFYGYLMKWNHNDSRHIQKNIHKSRCRQTDKHALIAYNRMVKKHCCNLIQILIIFFFFRSVP